MSLSEIERKVLEKYYESIYRFYWEHQLKRPKGIHVSDLIYSCLRRAYYYNLYGTPLRIDPTLTLIQGIKLHEIPMSDFHEVELSWEGIVGTIDEIVDGIIVDKKYVSRIPKSPYEHHATQVNYYRVLAVENGIEVKGLVVLYIDVGSGDVRPYQVNMWEYETTKWEMLKKRDILRMAYETGIPPPRKVGWLCRYCDFCGRCFVEGLINVEEVRTVDIRGCERGEVEPPHPEGSQGED